MFIAKSLTIVKLRTYRKILECELFLFPDAVTGLTPAVFPAAAFRLGRVPPQARLRPRGRGHNARPPPPQRRPQAHSPGRPPRRGNEGAPQEHAHAASLAGLLAPHQPQRQVREQQPLLVPVPRGGGVLRDPAHPDVARHAPSRLRLPVERVHVHDALAVPAPARVLLVRAGVQHHSGVGVHAHVHSGLVDVDRVRAGRGHRVRGVALRRPGRAVPVDDEGAVVEAAAEADLQLELPADTAPAVHHVLEPVGGDAAAAHVLLGGRLLCADEQRPRGLGQAVHLPRAGLLGLPPGQCATAAAAGLIRRERYDGTNDTDTDSNDDESHLQDSAVQLRAKTVSQAITFGTLALEPIKNYKIAKFQTQA